MACAMRTATSVPSGRNQPMTDFHKKVLNRARADIVATMTAKTLLNQLISDEILEIEERLEVLRGTGPSEQNDNLMDKIHWKPDRAYECFKRALRSVGQGHVADLIEEKEVQLETELEKRESKLACPNTNSMCNTESEHGLTSVQNSSKAVTDLTSSCPVEVSFAMIAENKTRTLLQKTSTSELPGIQQLAICEPMKDDTVADTENVVALFGVTENDDNRLAKRLEERKRCKRAESRKAISRQQTCEGGCTLGVKLSVGEVRTSGDRPGSKELLRETANYIWRTLSYVVRKPKCDNDSEGISLHDQTGIYEFLRSFETKDCQVKHVGAEPVLFVVNCMNLESLKTITSLHENWTFVELLEQAVRQGTFAQQHDITDVTLVTDISEQEIKLCKRVLGKLENSLKLAVQTTPERFSQIEFELYQQVQKDGSDIATAARARITNVEHSSILLTLQFQSLDDLKSFKEDLDSGQLTRLVEDVLIKDVIKKKYCLDNLGLSVTLVDPWEYEMCEIELALTDERAEDSADNNLDEEEQLETEGETPDCCHNCCQEVERLLEKISQLEESKKHLSEKAKQAAVGAKKSEKERKTVPGTVMAAGGGLQSMLSCPIRWEPCIEPLLDCPICMEPFDDPRMLTCLHSLCHKCLNDIIERSTQTFQCPVCRESLQIPPEGADAFPKNFFINSCMNALAEGATTDAKTKARKKCFQATTGVTTRPTACSNADGDDDCSQPEHFCSECCEFYCMVCSRVHRKLKASRDHTLVPLDELTEELLRDAVSQFDAPRCQKHRDEKLKLYCCTCKCAVCSLCCHITHQSHTFRELADVDGELKSQLEDALVRLDALVEGAKSQTARKEQAQKAIDASISYVTTTAQNVFQRAHQMLDDKATKMKQNITKVIEEKGLAASEAQNKSLALTVELLESLQSFSSDLLMRGTVYNRLANLPQIQKRLEQLQHEEEAGGGRFTETHCATDLIVSQFQNMLLRRSFEIDSFVTFEIEIKCHVKKKEGHVDVDTKPNENQAEKLAGSENQYDSQDRESTEDQPEVEITGIPPGISKAMIELFLEDKRQSGGGEIKRLQYSVRNGYAVVVYKDKTDAQRVADNTSLRFAGAPLVAKIMPKTT